MKGSRSGEVKRLPWIVGACLLLGAVNGAIWFNINNASNGKQARPSQPVPAKPPTLTTSDGASCKATNIDYGVRGEDAIMLRVSPDEKAAIAKQTAGDTTVDAAIDEQSDVRELCRAGNWSKVRVASSSVEGWVPSSALQKVKTSGSGRRIYTAADFEWPIGSAPARPAVLTIINRIIEQNPKCEAIDRQSLTMNGSGKGATFLIGCDGGEGDQSFEFTAADASNGRSFAPEKPIDPINKSEAREACQNAVTNAANHPSTVDFSMFDTTFDTFGNGEARYTIAFSAKNSFNLELTYIAHCEFKGEKLTSFVLTEK